MGYNQASRLLRSAFIERAIAGQLFGVLLFLPATAVAQTVVHLDFEISFQDETRIEVTETWDVDIDPGGESGPLEKRFGPIVGDEFHIDITEVAKDGIPQPWAYSTSDDDSDVSITVTTPESVTADSGRHRYVFRYGIETPPLKDFHLILSEYDSGFRFDRFTTATITIVGPPRMYVDVDGWSLEEHFAETGDPVRVELYDSGQSQRLVIPSIGNLGSSNAVSISGQFSPGFVGEGSGPAHLYRLFFPLDGPWQAIIVLLIVVYYAVAIVWLRGRRPDPVAASGAPLSPAAMRLLSLGRFDSIAIASAFLELARRGYIAIRPFVDGTQEVRRVPGRDPDALEHRDQRRLLDELFPARIDAVPLIYTQAKRFKSVVRAYETGLYRDFKLPDPAGRRFLWVGGVLFCAITLWMLSSTIERPMQRQVWGLYSVSFSFFFAISSIWPLLDHWYFGRQHDASMSSRLLGIFALLFFAVTTLIKLPDAIKTFGYSVPLAFGLVLIFSIWLAKEVFRPVPLAPDTARQIESMQTRLSELLNERNADGTMPHIRDELVPYAVALDTDGKWIARISGQVRRLLGHDPSSSLIPWYLNEEVGLLSFGKFAELLRSNPPSAPLPGPAPASAPVDNRV